MRQPAEAARRVAGALTALLLLAGCVTSRVPQPAMPAAQQADWLAQLPRFGIDGRSAVVADGQGFNASFTWRQVGAHSSVRLHGPLGAGSLTVEYTPEFLHVLTSRGEELHDVTAEQAIARELGFVPPFESLRYWMLGLPAPGGTAAQEVRDDAGQLLERHQHDWQVRYERWMDQATPQGVVRVPQRLTATRGSLRLRVFVDRWQLD